MDHVPRHGRPPETGSWRTRPRSRLPVSGGTIRFLHIPLAFAPVVVWDAAAALLAGTADVPTVLTGALGLTVSVLFLLYVRHPLR